MAAKTERNQVNISKTSKLLSAAALAGVGVSAIAGVGNSEANNSHKDPNCLTSEPTISLSTASIGESQARDLLQMDAETASRIETENAMARSVAAQMDSILNGNKVNVVIDEKGESLTEATAESLGVSINEAFDILKKNNKQDHNQVYIGDSFDLVLDQEVQNASDDKKTQDVSTTVDASAVTTLPVAGGVVGIDGVLGEEPEVNNHDYEKTPTPQPTREVKTPIATTTRPATKTVVATTTRPAATRTVVVTRTVVPTIEPTETPVPTSTNTPEPTPTETQTATATVTNTSTPESTATKTSEPTKTSTPESTKEPRKTRTSTPTVTSTSTSTPTVTVTNTPEPTPTCAPEIPRLPDTGSDGEESSRNFAMLMALGAFAVGAEITRRGLLLRNKIVKSELNASQLMENRIRSINSD